ncbi:hypothetical protein C1645_834332 [Glomus cerebriforme]|uniref:Amine oxidase domain-containing protein n=1 Tax=Glomus cerebriforme TaxID=658196 RepID=A0A397SEC6_9GLOM|nr:hypothetical protein C1645_834332 [Glomus cerebriforme]
MSFVLASTSSTINDYRRRPPKHSHVRLRIPNFFAAPFDPPPVSLLLPKPKDPTQSRICIIGAGMSGLFSVLLLQKARFQKIMILEYQNRVGGRVHTQYFNDDKKQKLYGELGAMRLPKTPEHQMVFDTIDYLNERVSEDDRIDLIKFIFADKKKKDESIMTQNDLQDFSKLGFPSTVSPHYKTLYAEGMNKFIEALDEDFDEGLKKLLMYDKYNDGICDRLSFVEAVIDAYTFMTDDNEWNTIDYGMQRFPNAFPHAFEYEENNGSGHVDIRYNYKVYKLENDDESKVNVYWEENGVPNNDVFYRVIVTYPLGVVCHWELPDWIENPEDPQESSDFYHKRRAIRELNYDNSAKIFLKFNSRFWEKQSNPDIVGGSSTTDLPIRTVIYPSYYVGMPIESPAILLGSYTWANDAAKYASYSQQENVKFCLKDLKILHGKEIEEQWDNREEYNSSIYWPNDPTTVGAFALFGPEQYETLIYPMIKSMYNIHWAGEHTDIHHAWIIGALNSAVRVVQEILVQYDMKEKWEELKKEDPLKNWHGHIPPPAENLK